MVMTKFRYRMPTDTGNGFNMKLYEPTRLSRYKDAPGLPMKHPPESLIETYTAWQLDVGYREQSWDAYCDVRDGYPMGTNNHLRHRYSNSTNFAKQQNH